MSGRLMHLGYSLAAPLLVLLALQLPAQGWWAPAFVMPAPAAAFEANFVGIRSSELIHGARDSLALVWRAFCPAPSLPCRRV